MSQRFMEVWADGTMTVHDTHGVGLNVILRELTHGLCYNAVTSGTVTLYEDGEPGLFADWGCILPAQYSSDVNVFATRCGVMMRGTIVVGGLGGVGLRGDQLARVARMGKGAARWCECMRGGVRGCVCLPGGGEHVHLCTGDYDSLNDGFVGVHIV